VLASRAAEAGIPDVRIRLLERDSAVAVRSSVRDGWRVRTGGTALRVGFRGGMGEVVGFLGSLPPYVTLDEVTVAPADDTGTLDVQARLLARTVTER
jgi:hypothetical protein